MFIIWSGSLFRLQRTSVQQEQKLLTATLRDKAETYLYHFIQTADNNYFFQIDTGMAFNIIIVRLHLE